MKEGWISDTLSNCIKLKSGDGLTAKKMIPGDFPVYGGNGIAGWHNQSNLDGKQIVIGRVGALCGKVRCINEKIWLTDNAFRISEYKYDLNHEFLTYLLNHVDLRSYARQAAQPVISNSSLKDVLLTFPKSLAEQKQIVTLLDAAFAKIDQAKANIEKNIANAKELFQSKLIAIFSQKGDGWEEKRVSELVKEGIIAKPLDGNHGDIHPKKSDFVEKGIPFIMASHLKNGKVNQDSCYFISKVQAESLRKGFAKNGDVLLSHKGTIGRIAILETKFEYVILTPQVTYYRILDKNQLSNRYLYFYFQSPNFQIPMNRIAGIGSTRAYIGITKQQNLVIRYPSVLSEQKKIVENLEKLSNETEKIYNLYKPKLLYLEELKKSLLQKAFTGELTSPEGTMDPKDGSIPSASAATIT